VRREDGVTEAGRGYLLIEGRIQARIMRHVRTVDRSVSRSELTDALGVSWSKTSLEVGRLLEAGLLVEDGLAESEGGRRSSLLRILWSAGLIAAVDLGATSIDVALSTLGSGLVAHRGESADVKAGPKAVLRRVKDLLAGLLEEQRLAGMT
jgi:DNA-binding transcriptional ArsR family regulator